MHYQQVMELKWKCYIIKSCSILSRWLLRYQDLNIYAKAYGVADLNI